MNIISKDFELKFEITEQCNSNCSFCHQGYGKVNSKLKMTKETFVYWLDWAEANMIKSIRLTGGEPTLLDEFIDFCRLAKNKGFYVTVNSNGLIKKSVLDEIALVIDEIKISLPTFNNKELEKITGNKNIVPRKMETISALKKSNVKISILTALLDSDLNYLSPFISFLTSNPEVIWSTLRLESTTYDHKPYNISKFSSLVENYIELKKKHPDIINPIGLSTPFCAIGNKLLGSYIFLGRRKSCGPFSSLTVTPNGSLISCYSCRNTINNTKDLADVYKDKEVLKLTQAEHLPKECQICEFLYECMGGCRNEYGLVENSNYKIDYLAKINTK